jgi:hypothetical protein
MDVMGTRGLGQVLHWEWETGSHTVLEVDFRYCLLIIILLTDILPWVFLLVN